jgi:alpha-beta hydrolase superfamily lysophospholipase
LKQTNLSRRGLLQRAVPALAGSFAALSSTHLALAKEKSPLNLPADPAPDKDKDKDKDNKDNEKVWSGEYWAKKGDLALYIFRKRLGAPRPGETAKPILFLAHGSSVSARPSFDLTVPGHGDYSLMDKFAAYGFDVWTMDFEGYGRSATGPGNSDIASGVEDIKAASEVIARETRQTRIHLYGESGGALRVGAFAMAQPERVDRLVLVSFTWTGQGSSTLSKRSESIEYYRTHNRRHRDRDMIRSIFTRDKPGTSDPAVAEAMADAELKFGDSAPTGTYLDMTTKLPIVDPLKLQAPVLIARGEYDGIATEEDLLNFFKKLPVPDREFVILPGASHSIALGLNRQQFWHVVRCFLEMPKRQDVQTQK